MVRAFPLLPKRCAMQITRRSLLGGLTGLAAMSVLPACAAVGKRNPFQSLEESSAGRLGVYALDSGSGRNFGWRSDELFGMCSTFKLLLAALVLREADAGRWSLDTHIAFTEADMVPHAPVTAKHLKTGSMSIATLAQATQQTSDNVAANLLIRHLGGPARLTAILREWGDQVTRLDRLEPQMNLVPSGEIRDTTSARAMAKTVAQLFSGSLLNAASQQRLRDWMIETKTGLGRIRAGLPSDWIAGDKTGTGIAQIMHNKHNDVAVIWLPKRKPIVVAAYFEASGYFGKMRAEDDAVLAQVGRIVARWISDAAF